MKIANNDLGNEGVKAIATALLKNRGLATLGISKCIWQFPLSNATADSAMTVANALRCNSVLTVLNFGIILSV